MFRDPLIKFSRTEGKYIVTNIDSWRSLDNRSAKEELAYNILRSRVGEGKALQLYERFKADVIDKFPDSGGVIYEDDISAWLKNK